MARKSVKASEARERARERANRFLERENLLLEIAELYEEVRAELEGIEEATERKIAKIREQAEAKIEEAREGAVLDGIEATVRAQALQRRMLDVGIGRKEVGERLGIPTRDVVRKPFMDEESAAAAAKDLAAQGGQISVRSRPDQELYVNDADGTIVWCNVWVGGEEQHGDSVEVDLAREVWEEA